VNTGDTSNPPTTGIVGEGPVHGIADTTTRCALRRIEMNVMKRIIMMAIILAKEQTTEE
jgi:hypothetical protein